MSVILVSFPHDCCARYRARLFLNSFGETRSSGASNIIITFVFFPISNLIKLIFNQSPSPPTFGLEASDKA